ncbi:MAG: ATP-binding cassette domain-containing protein [Sulfurimonas sp.]|nr:ATP-binding cassette domain-containing protein [Sulfurimonas sp.]
MIECKNLSYSYQDFQLNEIEVLKDINFKIDKDEKVLLLGINGSGKSTLLKLLNGLLFAKNGEYHFKNELVNKKYLKANSRDFRKNVSLQMQDPSSMLFNPSVYDEIAFGLKHFGFDNIEDRTHHYAKNFGIEDILKSSPLSLSGGQKQKVLLASLLCVEPEVLLLDEPTAHLDPPTTGWLVEFLESLDVTAIVSTHNISLGKELAQRAIVIGANHEVIYDGSVDALLEDMPTLIKAQLVHKHKHNHDGVEHKHYHLHSWP